MSNKFNIIVHRFENDEFNKLDYHKKYLFSELLKANKDFNTGTITFHIWNLKDYQMRFPDALKQIIDSTYKNSDGDYYWGGDYYDSYESILDDISAQKVLLELELSM